MEKNTTFTRCPKCNGDRNHLILTEHVVNVFEEIEDSDGFPVGARIEWRTYYQIIKCNGCDFISFREYLWCSAFIKPGNENGIHQIIDLSSRPTDEIILNSDKGYNVLYIKHYPHSEMNPLLAHPFNNVPPEIKNIYFEIVACYNNNNWLAASSLIRVLIEKICNHFIIVKVDEKPLSLADSIYQLPIGPLLKKSLKAMKFLGNRALHNAETATKEELITAIFVSEHLLISVFEFPIQSKILDKLLSKRFS